MYDYIGIAKVPLENTTPILSLFYFIYKYFLLKHFKGKILFLQEFPISVHALIICLFSAQLNLFMMLQKKKTFLLLKFVHTYTQTNKKYINKY